MIEPRLVLILAACYLTYLAGLGVVTGVKKVGHETKKAGVGIVHVVTKVGHKLNPCDGSDCLFER